MVKKLKCNYKLIFLVIIFFFFLLSLVTYRIYPSLKFFLIIPVAILIGLSYPVLLSRHIPVKNILSYLILCLFFGFFSNTLIIFILGLLGIPITLFFFKVYISIMLLLNLLIYIFYIPETKIESYFKNFKLDFIDIIWLLISAVSFLFFMQICTEMFFPNWDNFTYWAIDAKYIFESGKLDGKSLDVLTRFYLPLYPLQTSYVYFLYGEVVEQFSSLITLLYGFIALFLLNSYIISSKRGTVVKSLLYLLSFTGMFSFFLSLNTLVTQYSDVFCGVLMLFYGIVLFSNEPSNKNYWLRALLVFLFSLSLYLTKLAYAPISLLLLVFFILYDIKFLINEVRKLDKKLRLLLYLALFLICIVVILFVAKSSFLDSLLHYKDVFSGSNVFTRERFTYLDKILRYLLNRIPELILTAMVLMSCYFSVNSVIRIKDVKKIVVVIILAFIPITFYFLIMKDIKNGSLLRYFSLIFFLLPYLFIDISPDIRFRSKIFKSVVLIVLILVVFAMSFKMFVDYKFSWEFTPTSGKYKDSELLKGPYVLAKKVRDIIPDRARVMLVGEESNERLGNIAPPNLYVRYYLAENSVGSQYVVPSDEWLDYMKGYEADYIFVSKYSGFWPLCDNHLSEGHYYLIKVDKDNDPGKGCFFEANDLVEIIL